MRKAENVNAPWLGGWIIGAAAGLVGFGVLVVVGEFDLFPAAAIGVVVAGLAGLILGMPWGTGRVATFDAARPAAEPEAKAATAVEVPPVAAVTVPPAAFVAVPVAVPSVGPERLAAPRDGRADNLKEIEGIGPAMEKLVNDLGFYHFSQIAGWSDGDVAWVDANMKTFKGRITRDRWVAQAKIIVSEGLEAFRERARTNNY